MFNHVSWRKQCFENTQIAGCLWQFSSFSSMACHAKDELEPRAPPRLVCIFGALTKLVLHPLLYQELYSLKEGWAWGTLHSRRSLMGRSYTGHHKPLLCPDSGMSTLFAYERVVLKTKFTGRNPQLLNSQITEKPEVTESAKAAPWGHIMWCTKTRSSPHWKWPYSLTLIPKQLLSIQAVTLLRVPGPYVLPDPL